MRVLLVEADAAAAHLLQATLSLARATVDHVAVARGAMSAALRTNYDVVVVGLDLPDMDGCEMVRSMRSAGVNAPVMVVSPNADATRKVKAFSAGVDDFVAIPFDCGELEARLHAVARRGRGPKQERTTLRAGRLTVLLHSQEVFVDDQRVPVTAKEFEIMELLMLRKGMTLSKDAFLAHLYHGMEEPSAKIVDVFICKLRRKLASAGEPNAIETVWGAGYRLGGACDTTMPGHRFHQVPASRHA